MLTPSFAILSRSIDLPVCLARVPAARLWLKDESLEDSANLPAPDVIAQEIVEDLEASLQQFAAIAQDLKKMIAHQLIRSCSLAHPSGLTLSLPLNRSSGFPIYVARRTAAPFARCFPRSFAFHVAHPVRSIRKRHSRHYSCFSSYIVSRL
jgi:hypothetical protein